MLKVLLKLSWFKPQPFLMSLNHEIRSQSLKQHMVHWQVFAQILNQLTTFVTRLTNINRNSDLAVPLNPSRDAQHSTLTKKGSLQSSYGMFKWQMESLDEQKDSQWLRQNFKNAEIQEIHCKIQRKFVFIIKSSLNLDNWLLHKTCLQYLLHWSGCSPALFSCALSAASGCWGTSHLGHPDPK